MISNRLRAVRGGRLRPLDAINLLALVVTVLAGLFIITGSYGPLLLVVLALVTGFGLDGVLRMHPAGRLRSATTAVFDLVTPVIFVIAAALFFRYVASGYWTVLSALATGLMFAVLAYAIHAGLDVEKAAGGLPRLVVLAADYAALFGLLGVFYSFDLSFPAAAALAGVAAALVALDVFRDADLPLSDHAIYALAAAVMLAQVRWALGFVRIDGLLAAVLLLLVFYVGTGVAVTAVMRRLDRRAGFEFTLVAVLGLVVVVVGRLATRS